MSATANTLWARAFVDELVRSGVSEAVVAPGSRSTPLVMALARHGGMRVRVHLDERSAGFFAVGAGKATGRPVAVVTTSGTAAANLLPAVVEAAQSEAPMLVLTADRPPRLRDADANQAIDQHRLYGRYARAFFDTGPALMEGPALRHLRTQACRAVAAAQGLPGGPVHVNLPFEKPLEPVPESAWDEFRQSHPLAAEGRPQGRPFVTVGRSRPQISDGAAAEIRQLLRDARAGVIVAGPHPHPESFMVGYT